MRPYAAAFKDVAGIDGTITEAKAEKLGLVQITIFSPVNELLYSQWGMVCYLEWCFREKDRLNKTPETEAEIVSRQVGKAWECAIYSRPLKRPEKYPRW